MRRLLFGGFLLIAVLAAGYWYAIDNSTPRETNYDFQLAELRMAASAPDEERPSEIELITVGRGRAPGFAVGFGLDFRPVEMNFSSFVIGYENGETVLVEAPADRDIAENDLGATFDPAAFTHLVYAMEEAETILITHEHLDHISVIPRHPRPDAIARALSLTAPQIAELPAWAPEGVLPDALQSLSPARFPHPTRIAPGIAVLETPGHAEGHLTIYVQMKDGREILMIGDIAWMRRNISDATTRPRFLQDVFFKVREDRKLVQNQMRALHNLAQDEPNLVILTAHDAGQHAALVRQRVLITKQ